MGPSVGLAASEVASLLTRALDGEPGVFSRRTERAVAHFTRGRLGGLARGPHLFVVATEGGMLIRPAPDEVDAFVAQDNIGANHAFPGWLTELARSLVDDEAMTTQAGSLTLEDVLGHPSGWCWVSIENEASFLRRRPLVFDALGYARHKLEHGPSGEIIDTNAAGSDPEGPTLG